MGGLMLMEGLFEIEFVGEDEPRQIRISNAVVNGNHDYLYLIDEDESTIYNWSTIIKMTKIGA